MAKEQAATIKAKVQELTVNRKTVGWLRHGDELWHKEATNADGTPLRARVTGGLVTWKTRPEEFRLPVKHGLRECFYITQENCGEWAIPGARKEWLEELPFIFSPLCRRDLRKRWLAARAQRTS